jgi:hypothetical protein
MRSAAVENGDSESIQLNSVMTVEQDRDAARPTCSRISLPNPRASFDRMVGRTAAYTHRSILICLRSVALPKSIHACVHKHRAAKQELTDAN